MIDADRGGPPWVPAFLAALAESGNVTASTTAAGVATGTAYFRRRNNARFAEAWQAALASRKGQRNGGWRETFLEALAETSNVTGSAARADVPLRTVYKLRREDPAFAARWRIALHEGYDNLEMEMLGYLRGAEPARKMDVASGMRLLVAHRDTIARERAAHEQGGGDEQAVRASIDALIEQMRRRRAANAAVIAETAAGADDGAV